MIDIDDFKHEIECIYKDEKYSVRDNGAVFRYPRDGNMITSGLSGKPMINTDTWRLPPFVFILS